MQVNYTYIENKAPVINLSIAIGAIVALAVGFVENWIWSPFWSLFLMWVLISADFVSGVSVAFKRKEGFHSNKALKSVRTIISYTVILGFVFNFPKINTVFGTSDVQGLIEKFPGYLYMIIFTYLFLSFVKNLVLLGLIKGVVGKWIYDYIDVYKNKESDKFFKNDNNG